MDINAILYALGATGLFSARAFTPAFLTAVYMRWGQDIPFIGDADFLISVSGDTQTWFTSDPAIMVMGVLSVLEILGDKIPEAEELMGTLQRYARPTLAVLTYMGIANANDVATFLQEQGLAAVTMHAGLFSFDSIYAALLGFLTFNLGNLRDSALGYLRMLDEDNDLGLRNLISWMEDFWVIFGVIFVFVFPIFTVLMVAGVFAILRRIRRRYEKKEEASKIACPSCQKPRYKSAPHCPHCDAPNPSLHAVGLWGQSIDSPAPDLSTHKISLVRYRRCPHCATKLEKRSLKQSCTACSKEPFGEANLRTGYPQSVSARLPIVLIICAALSAVPILGLVVGIVYYRIQLVAPFRRYLSFHRNILAKWLARIFFAFLMLLQIIPFVGTLSVPLMALISYRMYSKGFRSQLDGVY